MCIASRGRRESKMNRSLSETWGKFESQTRINGTRVLLMASCPHQSSQVVVNQKSIPVSSESTRKLTRVTGSSLCVRLGRD